MSFSFDVDDGRHFKNPFGDYNPEELESYVNMMNYRVRTAIENLIETLELGERVWGNGHDASMYTGASGIAYALYHYGVISREIKYIKEAQRILEKYTEVSRGKKDISFVTGAAGPLALKTVLHNRTFDFGTHETSEKKSKEMISKLKSLSKYVLDEDSGVPDELLYGRVGYLYTLLFVNSQTSKQIFEDELIKEVAQTIISSGKNYSETKRSEPPLMYAWHEKEYLGGAHGLAGILYVLLQARRHLTETQLKEDVEPSVHYLLKLRFKSRNFPSSIGNTNDKLVHWCHGAPSMTMLFNLAYKVFGKEEYFQAAIDCGDVIWTRGLLKKGYGICHGVSGNAYTFLLLLQQTKDKKYLYRALKFGEWVINEEKLQRIREPDRPYSLFEGKAGQVYFLADLLEPTIAKFPGYTV